MNMHYCRFTNTVQDMMDCIEDMDVGSDASEEEKEARKKFVELCVKVAEDYKHELKKC